MRDVSLKRLAAEVGVQGNNLSRRLRREGVQTYRVARVGAGGLRTVLMIPAADAARISKIYKDAAEAAAADAADEADNRTHEPPDGSVTQECC